MNMSMSTSTSMNMAHTHIHIHTYNMTMITNHTKLLTVAKRVTQAIRNMKRFTRMAKADAE